MMALESVSVAETVIQSNDDNDLEDGEIPSDEDDEPVMVIQDHHKPEPPKPPPEKVVESVKKTFDNKFVKSKAESEDKRKSNNIASEDWAGDVEKAIRAALDEDTRKVDNKPKGKNNKGNKNRKRNREDSRDEERKDQKKKKPIDEVNANEDDDEMLFVRGASPSRRGDSHERDIPSPKRDHENYHSGSDYEDRPGPNRHREEKRSTRWTTKQAAADRNKKISVPASRRNVKNDRPGKNNKGGRQLRNDRNCRRNQGNDHNQDPDAICVYYMQGKCHRGDDCPYSHDALPPRKMELCKFYLMDCCAKRDKCLYMHHDFPCKFFHTGSQCSAGENCKFSHDPMNEQVKNILLKHLETAPKEILGNFPRLSREGALSLINNTEKSIAQGHGISPQKIPSLFELKVPTPPGSMTNECLKEEGEDHSSNRDKMQKDRKKTRWGSNDDRVPIDMVLQSASQLGLQFGANQDKPQTPVVNFYGEGGPNDVKVEKEEPTKNIPPSTQDPIHKEMNQDIDFRQLLGAKPQSSVVSIADEAAKLSKTKIEEESDREEDASLIIEMSTDDEDKNAKKAIDTSNPMASILNKNRNSPNPSSQDVPATLPKRTQELYMRIQQQQREAEDSYKNLENNENQEINQDDWYSDDDSDDDDDDDDNQLTIVLKDVQKEEEKEKEEEDEEKDEEMEEEPLQPSLIPQPAPITDTIGTLSKIDVSAKVSTLLSTLKARAGINPKLEKEVASKPKKENEFSETTKPNLSEMIAQYSKMETTDSNPGSSPLRVPDATSAPQATAASRDPRMSRDPRQRRDEQRQSSVSSNSSSNSIPPSSRPAEKESRLLKPEMSIYSSGIIASDADIGQGRSVKPDQDHRRKDMDLRCFPPGPSFGDTDLRLVGGHYAEAKSGDVDLRQMLSLPFKPVPSHVPCTEIEASISSHPPIPYKVFTVDIPRPDYTGLKLTKNDPQVRYDPRLRKIFRLPRDDIADSPMSPPPVKMLDTPKSPPLVRADPRRKALESQPPKIIPTSVQQHVIQDHTNLPGIPMGMPSGYMQPSGNMQGPVNMQGPPNMQGSGNMQGPGMMQNMGPQPLMMQSGMNSQSMMMSNSSMMRDGPMMGGNGGGMNQDMRMRNMGPPPGSNHMQQQHPGPDQHQMNQYDPRYNAQRGNSVGLLGAAPSQMGGYNNHDMRGQYDGPQRRYPNDGYGKYGNQDRGDPRSMYNHNGPMDDQNYSNNQSDWKMNQGRPNRKERRRPQRGKFGGMGRKKDMS